MPVPDNNDFDSHHKKALHQSVIMLPLQQEIQDEQTRLATPAVPGGELPRLYSVIIDLNLEFPGKRSGALEWVVKTLNYLVPRFTQVPDHIPYGIDADKTAKNQYNQQYLFVQVEGKVLQELVQHDLTHDEKGPEIGTTKQIGKRAIYHVWSDFEIIAHINKSIATIKGDAAQAAYSAFGEGIVWAVMDSGIDGTHPHFTSHGTLDLEKPLAHTDFTGPSIPTPVTSPVASSPLAAGAAEVAVAAAAPAAGVAADTVVTALTDAMGHGTHVAGIIAGSWSSEVPPKAYNKQRDETGNLTYVPVNTSAISGMAQKCKLLSLKVLDGNGTGNVSNLIAAISMIQELNGYGRHLLVHGVNMSVGYEFKPEWFACGQSPLCVEVNRLVKSGVVVVVAAGNTGYGPATTEYDGVKPSGRTLTINDPGNAELAITVGSTHRDMPHTYGVSYFSSKGPTGDGRLKPDLVAPGERILSCAAGKAKKDPSAAASASLTESPDYVEDTGTSMAAPHVSGAIAAFLSIRREFIGRPEQVKEVFMSSATDLKREKYFQGSGLVDLMRAIQSV